MFCLSLNKTKNNNPTHWKTTWALTPIYLNAFYPKGSALISLFYWDSVLQKCINNDFYITLYTLIFRLGIVYVVFIHLDISWFTHTLIYWKYNTQKPRNKLLNIFNSWIRSFPIEITKRNFLVVDLRVIGFNQNPWFQTPQGTHHWSRLSNLFLHLYLRLLIQSLIHYG